MKHRKTELPEITLSPNSPGSFQSNPIQWGTSTDSPSPALAAQFLTKDQASESCEGQEMSE